jgi:hypothetical protein
MQHFWSYYNVMFGEDGALTRLEKALIGIAVARSKQCILHRLVYQHARRFRGETR